MTVTRFVGAAQGKAQLSGIFIHDPIGNILLMTAHVVITGVGIAPGAPPTGQIADLHRRFTLATQAFAGW
jgi:hypothetical protein